MPSSEVSFVVRVDRRRKVARRASWRATKGLRRRRVSSRSATACLRACQGGAELRTTRARDGGQAQAGRRRRAGRGVAVSQ
jgi:hypothetical protein